MTATLAHPFRVDSNGAAVTLEQGSARHAAEACGHIVSCEAGERPLAPLWGLMDPTGTRVNADEITATIGYAEPALLWHGSRSPSPTTARSASTSTWTGRTPTTRSGSVAWSPVE
jgi:hypothetical protein